jgi:transcriptional regulator with XRE-family HTH domain
MLEHDESAVAVGRRLKRLRLMAGLTRDALAQEADVGITSISYWEHAKPHYNPMKPRSAIKVLEAVRRAGVECSERWLLTGVGPAPRLISGQPFDAALLDGDNETLNLAATLVDKELQLFTASSPLAVTIQMEHNCMSPVIEKGDIVGGIWQAATSLNTEKICIVPVTEILQVRRVKKGTIENTYQLSYLAYDPAENTPFELKDIRLEKVAPIIRLWRY